MNKTSGRKDIKLCVVIPTYNNAATLSDVIERSLLCCPEVIVVDDGSTDDTREVLNGYKGRVDIVSHTVNRGKGAALVTGFDRATDRGFTHAITIDSDGQHYPEDIPVLAEASRRNPESHIIGQRDLDQKNMNAQSKFANKFSNFWFTVQTGVKMADTQTGYRLYALDRIYGRKLITSRYEAELELMVLASWKDVKLVRVPVRVYYPAPEERVSHFRPGYDFFRISVLNTVLCFLAVVYGYPSKLICRVGNLMKRKDEKQG